MDGLLLTNKNEKKVVKELHESIKFRTESSVLSLISSTYVPHYDSIIDENNKSNLAEVKMSDIINSKVKN
jgi:hypothetical protein